MWALWRKAANCFSDRRRQLLVSRLRGRCWPCTSPYKVTNNENKQLSAGASVEGRAMLRFIILWIEVARWLTIRQLLSSTDWHHWISSTKLAPTKPPLPQQHAYCIYNRPTVFILNSRPTVFITDLLYLSSTTGLLYLFPTIRKNTNSRCVMPYGHLIEN